MFLVLPWYSMFLLLVLPVALFWLLQNSRNLSSENPGGETVTSVFWENIFTVILSVTLVWIVVLYTEIFVSFNRMSKMCLVLLCLKLVQLLAILEFTKPLFESLSAVCLCGHCVLVWSLGDDCVITDHWSPNLSFGHCLLVWCHQSLHSSKNQDHFFWCSLTKNVRL